MKNNSIFDYNSDDVRSGEVTVEVPSDSGRKKTGSRLIYYAVVAALSLLLSFFAISAIVDRVNDGLVMELQTGEIDPMTTEDGTYTGSFSSGDMQAQVTVEVSTGYITDISLNSFSGIDTARAERVFTAVLAAQALDTGIEDVGSHPTDRILLKAIENAFKEDSAK